MTNPSRPTGWPPCRKERERPNQTWVADLTYLPTLEEGWCYLAVELDHGSRRVAGWSLGDSLAVPLVTEAFERAVHAWSAAPALHHSDRGAQYAWSRVRAPLGTPPYPAQHGPPRLPLR